MLELPSKIEIVNVDSKKLRKHIYRPNVVKLSNTEHEGKSSTRYQVVAINAYGNDSNTATYPPLNLYLKSKLGAGTKSEFTFYTDWEKGKSEEIIKEIEILPYQKPPRLKKFVVGAWARRTEPLDYFRNLGVWVLLPFGWGPGDNFSMVEQNAELLRNYREAGYTLAGGLRVSSLPGEAMATDIEGRKTTSPRYGGTCPTYRGKGLAERLKSARKLGKSGFEALNTVNENYWGGATRNICFCDRCLTEFKKFLQEKYPDVNYIEPQLIEEAFWVAPKLYQAWWEFKVKNVSELYELICKEFSEGVREKGGNPLCFSGTNTAAASETLGSSFRRYILKDAAHSGIPIPWYVFVDYEGLTKFTNVSAQYVLHFPYETKWRGPDGPESVMGDEAYAEYKLCGKNPKYGLVPIVQPTYGVFYSKKLHPWYQTHLETMRSQLLEMIVGGAKGFISIGEGSWDGYDLKGFGDVVRMIGPVEYLIMRSAPLPPETFQVEGGPLRVRGLSDGKEFVILTADYSPGPDAYIGPTVIGKIGLKLSETYIPLGGKVILTIPQDLTVYDLETLEKVAELKKGRASFSVKLDPKKRSRLFYLGLKPPKNHR